jgi:hypothetical protein
MPERDLNSTRAGRSIDYLDNRRGTVTDPGSGDPHGNRMPKFENEILEKEATDALDHVQVSAIADVAPDGKVTIDESETEARTKKPR